MSTNVRTEEFQLSAPKGQDNDEVSLGDQTTNCSSIEIEVEDVAAEVMRTLDQGRFRWKNS